MSLKPLFMLLTAPLLFGCGYLGRTSFDDLAEVVFIYQLTSQRPPSEQKDLIYFVSINQREDPSPALLERLNKKGFRVRPISQSLMKEGELRDKASSGIGLWLSIYDVQCTSRDTCSAKGAIQSDRENLVGWKYQLIKENGKWKVKDVELYLEG